jgi:hypothetical protein
MREVLEPVFGESGAIVAQFLVILVFVLILTGVCYWLFRRYYGTSLPTGGRSRVPRLGVVDSLSIDHRHRLVLIRRDNVEHLLLIGKTTDLVVEPSVARSLPAGARPRPGQAPRQQPQQRGTMVPSPQQTATPPAAPTRTQAAPAPGGPAARPESAGISEPIPFPHDRRPPNRSLLQTAEVPEPVQSRAASETAEQRKANAREAPVTPAPGSREGVRGPSAASASAHFEEPARPTRVEPAFSLADALDEIADETVAAGDAPDPARPEPASAAVEPDNATAADDRPAEAVATDADETPPIVAARDAGQAAENQGESNNEDRAATVSNLEQEMARLLGQITAKRDA